MTEFLPTFIKTYQMSSREIIMSLPEFRHGEVPAIELVEVTH